MIEQFDEADTARQKSTAAKKTPKAQEELAQARNMRNASLEILDETRKRKENDVGEG